MAKLKYILLFLLVASAAACSRSSGKSDGPAAAPASPAPPAGPPPPAGKAAPTPAPGTSIGASLIYVPEWALQAQTVTPGTCPPGTTALGVPPAPAGPPAELAAVLAHWTDDAGNAGSAAWQTMTEQPDHTYKLALGPLQIGSKVTANIRGVDASGAALFDTVGTPSSVLASGLVAVADDATTQVAAPACEVTPAGPSTPEPSGAG